MQLDPVIFEQLKTGKPAAFAALIEQFEGPLFRFFFCDHRNHHIAQEQTAETFAQLVRSLPGMRGRGPWKSGAGARARHEDVISAIQPSPAGVL